MANENILTLFRSKNTVLTSKEIALLWGETNKNLLKSRLNYYVKTGKLYSLRRGIYAKSKNYDKFELATKIYTPSYVGLETVLAKEGIIFQYYRGIFVVSYLSREIVCDGQKYIFKKLKDSILTNTAGLEKKENYFIASKERAFLDAVYLYKDYHFDNLAVLNWDSCFELLKIYQNKALNKKVRAYYEDYKNA